MYQKLIAATALLAMHGAYGDETLRCGRWIVDSSATIEELLKKCGSPNWVRSEEADRRTIGPNGSSIKIGTAVTEYWKYDRGRQAAAMIVIISDGKIRSIERDQS